MDLVLEIADTYALDSVYAKLLPLSLFAVSQTVNGTSTSTGGLPALAAPLFDASGKWAQFVSHAPHPPVVDVLSEFANDYHPSSFAQDGISAWPRSYIPRQLLSLTVITMIGIHVLYFLFAGLSYKYVFNHDMMRHPKFLKNQVKLEIISSVKAFPGMMALTIPCFFGEVRGWSQLYAGSVEGVWGWTYIVLSIPAFLLFTDYCIYWIHRWLHLPSIYKRLHKPHHKWLIPTPFASHAFHPMDGFAQSFPYHLYGYLFPIHRVLYLALFVAVNFWAIFIHDSDMITGHPLETIINGPAHHTLHHLFFTVNYGQYFTWADRVGGSYRQPESSLDPMLDIKAMDAQKVKNGKQE